jgi:hypothetical protein
VTGAHGERFYDLTVLAFPPDIACFRPPSLCKGTALRPRSGAMRGCCLPLGRRSGATVALAPPSRGSAALRPTACLAPGGDGRAAAPRPAPATRRTHPERYSRTAATAAFCIWRARTLPTYLARLNVASLAPSTSPIVFSPSSSSFLFWNGVTSST